MKKGKEKEVERSAPEEKHLRAGEHRFETISFYLIPGTCRYCSEYIIWAKGAQCKDCHYVAHIECAPEVPKDCAARLRRTRSISSPLLHDPPQKDKEITPSFNRHNIIKEGQLLKMGLSDGSWNPVWVILKGEALYIFRPQQHEIQYTTPLSTLSLSDPNFSVALLSALRPFSFVIYVKDEEYYFAALTAEDMAAWIKSIKSKRKQIKKNKIMIEGYQNTPSEMEQSFMFMSYISQPAEFAWEDIRKVDAVLLKLAPLLAMEEPRILLKDLRLGNLDLIGKEEVQYVRAKLPRVIKVRCGDERIRLINAELTDTPVPATFPEYFLVAVRYNGTTYRVTCKRDRTLAEVIAEDLLLKLAPRDMSCSWALPSVEEFVVKVGNMNEYIFETRVKLSAICYVRECLSRAKGVEFELVEFEPLRSKATNRMNMVPELSLNSSFSTAEADGDLGMETELVECYDIATLAKKFELRASGVMNFSNAVLHATNKFYASDIDAGRIGLFVVCGVYYGGELIAAPLHTQPALGEPIWDEWLKWDSLKVCDMPREARICFTLFACLSDSGGAFSKFAKLITGNYTEFVPLGWVNFNWVDFRGIMKSGKHILHMWPSTSSVQNPLGSCVPNSDPKSLALIIEFPTPPKPVVFRDVTPGGTPLKYATKPPTENEKAQLQRIAKKDALCSMTKEEKKLVWMYRYYLQKYMPRTLSKVLLSASWHVRAYVNEVERLIVEWEPLPVIDALELLDVRFPHTAVRRFAVKCLYGLSDRELVEYLPQLVQVLKAEPYHYSALSEFLLLRSIYSVIVAHPLFWHLMAEIHVPNIAVRFKLMIEQMLLGTGDEDLVKQFRKEADVVNGLADIALRVKTLPTPNQRKESLTKELTNFRFPDSFVLPNNQKFEASRVLVDKCRVMDSFTKPLWLVFGNEGGQTTQVIFKAGDDLRTDILALQMIRIMDLLWKNEGLDLHMQPYRAVSTGDGLGIIEVITDSQTTSMITQTYGGGGATSAWSTTALKDWLKAVNPTEKAHREAINNFTLSCAGYCVATYILGVGDRHNDNIMCSYAGNMFHIDFGYFLGQRVTFAGIPRETTPFVLTPDFAEAMGGVDSEHFKRFKQHCCQAYNIIRRHGQLFITLFVMMLSSGIEQLKELEDLYYLRDALSLDLTEEEAAEKFTQLIDQSLNNPITQLNNAVHIHFHRIK